jgi:hypothetical protein
MDTDIHRKFKPRFATNFANLRASRGLILRLQTPAVSGEGPAVAFRPWQSLLSCRHRSGETLAGNSHKSVDICRNSQPSPRLRFICSLSTLGCRQVAGPPLRCWQRWGLTRRSIGSLACRADRHATCTLQKKSCSRKPLPSPPLQKT